MSAIREGHEDHSLSHPPRFALTDECCTSCNPGTGHCENCTGSLFSIQDTADQLAQALDQIANQFIQLNGILGGLVERLTPHMERIEHAAKSPAGRLLFGRLAQ